MVTKHIRSLRRRLNIFGVVALAGLLVPIVMIMTEGLLIYLNPGYNPMIETISVLGLKPLGWVQSISFLVIGLLIEVFAFGLYFVVRRRKGFGVSIGILALFGFGLLLIGAFRTQPMGSPRTIENIIHIIAARTIFAFFPITCFLIAFSLKSDPNWRVLFIYTIISGSIQTVLVIIWGLSPTIYWFGLYERLLVANAVIWLEVMSVRLLILSFRGPTLISKI